MSSESCEVCHIDITNAEQIHLCRGCAKKLNLVEATLSERLCEELAVLEESYSSFTCATLRRLAIEAAKALRRHGE